MIRMKMLGAGLYLAVSLASGSALAGGHHQICFQGPNTSTGLYTAIYGCRADDPNVSCTVDLAGTTTWAAGGLLKKVTAYSSGSYAASIQFSDGTVRSCTAYVFAPPGGVGSSQPSLVGYTTDSSGRLMTGVWTQRSNQNASLVKQVLSVPPDFVVVGGGVVGAEVPYGALAIKSVPYGDLDQRLWAVGTQDDIYPQPHDDDGYAIGLKIEGLDIYALRPLISTVLAVAPDFVAGPTATASTASGTIALGGGAYGWGPGGNGQYLTASFPNLVQNFCHPACEQPFTVTGWTGTSKDHGVSVPGKVTVDLFAITGQFSVAGSTFHVVSSISAVTSGLQSHPSAVVSGAAGEYALTGIGAYVDWRSYGTAGNLLWKLLPRPDLAGVEVASKDHAFASPATITGYALGVKLVPGPYPVWQPPVLH